MRFRSLSSIASLLLLTACHPRQETTPPSTVVGASAQKKAPATTTRVTFLHTNDEHSRLVPFANAPNAKPAMGGVVARKSLIDTIRREGRAPNSLIPSWRKEKTIKRHWS